MFWSGWEALQDVMEWTGGLLRSLEVVGWPSRMSGSDREAFPDGWEWSGGPPRCP